MNNDKSSKMPYPELTPKVVDAIDKLWDPQEKQLRSETVYEHLLHEGIEIPRGAMSTILKYLKEDIKVIRGPLDNNSEAANTHGSITITWVHPEAFPSTK